MQGLIINVLTKGASNPKALRDLYKQFGIAQSLPFDKTIAKWVYQQGPTFWSASKAIPKALIMNVMRNGIHVLVTTEEAIVLKDYGTSDAKVIGKKTKLWDVWFKYFDAAIMLERDSNSTRPPYATINPLQYKMRLQGMNPKWTMDWEGFTNELEATLKREKEEIPDELKIENTVVQED